MKKQMIKKLLSCFLAGFTALQCMAVGITVSAETTDTFPTYTEENAFSSAQQGTNGWYFMYENGDIGEYIKMTESSGSFEGVGGAKVDANFITPGSDKPAVIAWEVPYDGTVKLTTMNSRIYRSSGHENGGDVIVTLMLNDTILTDDNDKTTQWTFDKNCNDKNKDETYTVSNLKVKKGDVLYHKVDCGTNNVASSVYWKPIVTYTECAKNSEFKSKYVQIDAYDNCKTVQGYDGWYYYKKDTTGYTQLPWDNDGFRNNKTVVKGNGYLYPGSGAPVAAAWKAPYTGVVTLSHQDTVYRNGNSQGGDITATLKLNNTVLTDDNGQETTWTFANNASNTEGSRKTYTVSNLQVNKGDIIYHEVDCGTNDDGERGIFWKPVITYTQVDFISSSKSKYVQIDAYNSRNNVQGYDGWYYYKKGEDDYTLLPWDNDGFRDAHTCVKGDNFLYPGSDAPVAAAWKAPYTGVVTLSHQDTVYRDGPNSDGGDVIATLKLNGTILTDDNNQQTQWTFTKDASNTEDYRKTYTVSNLQVNKGDIIYHEVDCGTNETGRGIYWKPVITYTSYANTDADTYSINTITDYKNFADVVRGGNSSARAKLTADIEWNSNTPQLENFAGTIDGDGHKITLRGKALIKSAENGTTIKNLIVDGAVAGAEKVGAFAETTGTGATLKISNSANLANVTASVNYAGGFIGFVADGDTVEMLNCYGNGKVTGIGDVANPFACKDENATVTYTNCYYLSNGTTNGSGTVSPSEDGVDANDLKTFVILNNGMAYGYSENAGKLIIAEYKNSVLTKCISINDVAANTFMRKQYTSEDGDTVKAFVWGGNDGVIPACPHFVLDI